ncbi:MAG: hypothetical protein HGA83_03120 [Bacteroidales bacterium]|nr:hypothetical protein [Bacteroidales bacterium]
MREKLFIIAAILVVASSCKKEITPQSGKECTISIKLNNGRTGTKATEPFHDTLGVSGGVKELHVFLFDALSNNISTYKKILNPDSLKNISIKTTMGQKNIYILANPHNEEGFGGVLDEEDFMALQTSLLKEEPGYFTMFGNSMNFSVGENSVADIRMERFISKIVLNSLKTECTGGPFEGLALKDVRVYLLNIVAKKKAYDGSEAYPLSVLNLGSNIPAGYLGAAIKNMVYDSIPQDIGDVVYNTKHHFYAYSNTTDVENSYIKYTKLVIEGTLNGTKYYYPIPVNKTGYGASDNKGILRNTVYKMDVVIKNAGSLSPGSFLPTSSYTTNLEIADFGSFDLGVVEL